MSEKDRKILDEEEQYVTSGVPEKMKLSLGNLAHYYALLIYHNYKKTDALKDAQTKSYDEMNKLTHIDYFINSAKEGIEKYLFLNGMKVEDFNEAIHGDFEEYGTGYLEMIGRHIFNSFDENEMTIYDKYMEIAEYMNNKRIQENVDDDFYDKPSDEHMILRNLPLELAGLNEAHNYLTIMMPFVDKFNLPQLGYIGSHESDGKYIGLFDSFVDTEMFYSVRVLNFLENNNIRSKEDLKNYLKNIGKNFDPLKPENAPEGKKELAEKRLKQMTDDKVVDKLTDYLLKTNSYIEEIFDEFKEMQ